MTSHDVPDELVIQDLAARQHGVVSRAQLLGAGLAATRIDHRIRAHRLHRLHRGVYRVGPLDAPAAPYMAAVLACGDAAALSHWSAGHLWRLPCGSIPGAAIDVLVTRGRAGPRPGIRIHRMRTVRPDELTVRDGVPVTNPARTLLDLAGVCRVRDLERALAEALALRIAGVRAVRTLLDRHERLKGAAVLRRLLDGDVPPALTRSEAEERFLVLIRKSGLRPPGANVKVRGVEVDFLWHAERLVVEVDGVAYHGSRRSFENDRRRDAVLVAAGLRVMRVTWHQITREPEAVICRVSQALARPLA